MKSPAVALMLFIFYNIILVQCTHLKGTSNDFSDLYSVGNDYNVNSLIPGKDSVEKLKGIISSLITKIDEIGSGNKNKPSAGPHFKYLEVKVPPKGNELKIKHNLEFEKILNVNVNIINGNILKSQADLINHNVLFNWYVDNEHIVLIRPNNLDFKDNLFLENARLRIVLMLK